MHLEKHEGRSLLHGCFILSQAAALFILMQALQGSPYWGCLPM